MVIALVKADSSAEALRDITWHAEDALAASERLSGTELVQASAAECRVPSHVHDLRRA